jgi:aryl-alcohol dehydrogenase-like predicted oxidoreductase
MMTGSSKTDNADIHDVEHRADEPFPQPSGFPLQALSDPRIRQELHLDPPYAPLGPGEQSILDTFAALRELQAEGKIKKIGIAGYPLPYLLRLALLIRDQTGKPVDILQTYSHQTLLNSALSSGFLEAFEKAGVKQVVNAAPLAMGVLTTQGGPAWHPIRDVEGGRYYQATREAAKLCQEKGTTLEAVASDFGYRPVHQSDAKLVPVVIGCKNMSEVHRALESYARVAYNRTDSRDLQEQVRNLFEEAGVADWSWANPGPGNL